LEDKKGKRNQINEGNIIFWTGLNGSLTKYRIIPSPLWKRHPKV
jgi:hypothetical protein